MLMLWCSTAALLGAVRLAQGGPRLSFHLATGAAVGLAVACKVTGLALLFPVGVAILIGVFTRRDPPADSAREWRLQCPWREL